MTKRFTNNRYYILQILIVASLVNLFPMILIAVMANTKDENIILFAALITMLITIPYCTFIICLISEHCEIKDNKLYFRNAFYTFKIVEIKDIKRIEFVNIIDKHNNIVPSKPVIIIRLSNNKISKYKYSMSKKNDHFAIDLNQVNYNILKEYLISNDCYLLDMISSGEYSKYGIES